MAYTKWVKLSIKYFEPNQCCPQYNNKNQNKRLIKYYIINIATVLTCIQVMQLISLNQRLMKPFFLCAGKSRGGG